MRANRKDYEKLVEIVQMLEKGKTKRIMWAIALAELLQRSNRLFDKKRFIEECSKDEGWGPHNWQVESSKRKDLTSK